MHIKKDEDIEINRDGDNLLLRDWADINSYSLKAADVDMATGEIVGSYNFKGTIIECPFPIYAEDLKPHS